MACWAHARRKFFEARSNAPREANEVLESIRQLYDLEDQAREWTAEERLALRQREALPIIDRIERYLDDLSQRVLPKSALGKAVTYARNQRAALRQYTSDGRLTIDHNVSERTLRLQAVGRNYADPKIMQSPDQAIPLFVPPAGTSMMVTCGHGSA